MKKRRPLARAKKKAKPIASKVTAQGRSRVGTNETPTSLPAIAPTAVKELTPENALFLDAFIMSKKRTPMRPLPSFVTDSPVDGVPRVKPDPGVDEQLWRAQLATVVGSSQKAVQRQIMTDLVGICAKHGSDPAVKTSEALSLLVEIEPRDAIEARLAAQIVTTHTVAMDLLKKGLRGGDSILVSDFYLRHAERLMRLFGHQVESLSRYRGKAPSEQRVTVEHVHVHEGGQAVVGNVSHPAVREGRGDEPADP
jgi:hypothetical protein